MQVKPAAAEHLFLYKLRAFFPANNDFFVPGLLFFCLKNIFKNISAGEFLDIT
jgi:hypothetical protein